jgi:hypothetical protein
VRANTKEQTKGEEAERAKKAMSKRSRRTGGRRKRRREATWEDVCAAWEADGLIDEEQEGVLREVAAGRGIGAEAPYDEVCAELRKNVRPRVVPEPVGRWAEQLDDDTRERLLRMLLRSDPESLVRLCATDRETRALCRIVRIPFRATRCEGMELSVLDAARLAADIGTDDPDALCVAHARRCWLYAFLDWRLRWGAFKKRPLLENALDVMLERTGPVYADEESEEAHWKRVSRWLYKTPWSVLGDVARVRPEDFSLADLVAWAEGPNGSNGTAADYFEASESESDDTEDEGGSRHGPGGCEIDLTESSEDAETATAPRSRAVAPRWPTFEADLPSLRAALERWVVPTKRDPLARADVEAGDTSPVLFGLTTNPKLPRGAKVIEKWGNAMQAKELFGLLDLPAEVETGTRWWRDGAEGYPLKEAFSQRARAWLERSVAGYLPEACRQPAYGFWELFDPAVFVGYEAGSVVLFGAMRMRDPPRDSGR